MRMILPTEEEYIAWLDHPCTQFVAKAHEMMADAQRDEWQRLFDGPSLDPAKIVSLRLELKTREDAYRAFMETTFVRYLTVVDPEAGALLAKQAAAADLAARREDHQRRPQSRQNRRSAA